MATTNLRGHMTSGSPLMEVLDEFGHWVSRENLPKATQKYHKVPYTTSAIAGLVIHSLISQHPRQNFYTDTEHIWYPGKPELELGDDIQDIGNALREYAIIQIISAHPTSTKIYGRCYNNDLWLCDFSTCFSRKETAYDIQMQKLMKGREGLVKYERHRIKMHRLSDNGEYVDRFLAMCKKDTKTMYIAETLEKNLKLLYSDKSDYKMR